jgi:hypothetical protein
MIEVTVTSVILPFLCLKCLKCEEITKNAKIREPLAEQGKKCACGHLDIPDAEVSAEMLADMQIQLERAQVDVRILKEIQGLDEALIQDLKKQIELYKQCGLLYGNQLDEANNKIADLETSRNNFEKELAEMTIQSNNEHHRGDLYRDWYRETYQKYMAERDRTWWSRLCN